MSMKSFAVLRYGGFRVYSVLHAVRDVPMRDRNTKGHLSKGVSTDPTQAFELWL